MRAGNPEIKSGIPVAPIRGRGNRRGNGRNLVLLRNMKVGDSVWNIPKWKMQSIKRTAWHAGIKIRVRKIPTNGMYAIWRIGEELNENKTG